MRLHHHPFSANARRALMTALHLGTPVELVSVDLAKGEQRGPKFLGLNPFGRVPVLEDGEFVLTESHAIMQYLADKTPGQTLYPTDLRARGDVTRWMFWNAHHFAPAVSIFGWQRMVKKMLGQGEPDPNEIARGERELGMHAAVLDKHLMNREWVSGDKLSLADLAIATPLMITVPAALPVTQFANLQAWFARVQQLDAWKKTSL
jgi:glutathione S-transferase